MREYRLTIVSSNDVQGEDTEEEIAPEDTDDGEFDPSDEDDMDFQVAVTSSPWSKRQRTPSTKKLVKRLFLLFPFSQVSVKFSVPAHPSSAKLIPVSFGFIAGEKTKRSKALCCLCITKDTYSFHDDAYKNQQFCPSQIVEEVWLGPKNTATISKS